MWPSSPARCRERRPLSDAVVVDTWNFEAQVATDSAAYDDTSVWGVLVRELVSGHELSMAASAPLKCAAEQLARFHAKNGALPDESLRRFISARCGAVTAGVAPVYWSVTTPTPIRDEELATKVRTSLGSQVAGRLDTGHHQLGLAAARFGARTSVVLAVANDETRLESGGLTVDAQRRVTLRGAVRGQYEAISVLINRGEVGTAFCSSDPQVQPPRFAATCELAPEDRFAWVEITGRRPGEILVHDLAETIVHTSDEGTVRYVAHHAGPPHPVTSPAEFSRAMLEGLNRVRTGAGLSPLKLADKQSGDNARLAGMLIDASVGGDDAGSNRAAVGLLAGWDVDGMIRNGAFFLKALRTTDATAWLDSALERPVGRFALLDPNAREIAIGPAMPPEGGAVGAAVTTYALFDSDDHAADATRFFARVADARAALGLSAPVRIRGVAEMNTALARVNHEGAEPMDALHATMQVVVARTGHGVRGYALETNDLDQVEVPRVLLTPGPLPLVLGVTHHRVQGAAWGQYVVVIVVVGKDEAGTMTAERPGPGPKRF